MVSNNNNRGIAPSIAVGILLMILLMLGGIAAAVETIGGSGGGGSGGGGGGGFGSVEIRGDVAEGPFLWDAYNFQAFFYDFQGDVKTENLNVSSIDIRIIPAGKLVYSTSPEEVSFISSKFGKYQAIGFMGEKYFAGYTINTSNSNTRPTTNFDGNSTLSQGQLHKVLIDDDTKRTISVGGTLALKDGYVLKATDIDTNAQTMLLSLLKDGTEVDITPLSMNETYVYNKTVGGVENLPLIMVGFDNIFSDQELNVAFVKGLFQLSENATSVEVGNKFGNMNITTVSSDIISMKNDVDIGLDKNTNVVLMGNIKLKVADSDNLRFYPYAEYTIPGTYEIRGTIADMMTNPDRPFSWDARSFAGFYYDLKNNRQTETLTLVPTLTALSTSRTIDKEQLWYNTTKAQVNFKAYEKEEVFVNGVNSYNIVGWQGEKFVAIKGIARKLAKLVLEMGPDDTKTLTTGETWSLGAGYDLTINAVDTGTAPKQVWFTLKKDGVIVDEGIGQAPSGSSIADKEKAVYTRTKIIQGESDVLLFSIYVNNISANTVQFKYAWLIDESSAKEIKAADKFGAFEVRTASDAFINLSNENTISLSRNTETTLIGGIKFKVADNDILRLYPKVDYTVMDSSSPPYFLSININNGEAYTSSNSVTLGISAVNAAEMSFSNDGASWSSWEPYRTTRSWILIDGNGLKSVFFKARNAAGEASSVSDTIILATPEPVFYNKVEIRGKVVNEPAEPFILPIWNANSFGAFYYDLKYDRSTETLGINDTLPNLNSTRTINKDVLWYNTTKAQVNFKAYEKEWVSVNGTNSYNIVGWQGEKWIAINQKANKLAKLVFEMGKEDKKTLTTGETWFLGAGYELTINAIDARTSPRQVRFTLKKDGIIVDNGIGQVPLSSTIMDKEKAVYYKTKTIQGESDALLFTVYVDTIFSGSTSDMVQFKYAWLIDESSAKEIKATDRFGVFEVRSADDMTLKLSNENPVSLSKNSETTIMGNLKFRIADSDILRFYPYVEYTTPGTYEIRGTVADMMTNPDTPVSWDARSFAGFYYDLKYNRQTETLTLVPTLKALSVSRTIDKENLWYNTTRVGVDFKVVEKEGVGNVSKSGKTQYQLVGWQAEKWIAINDKANKIAKLTFEMGKEDKKTLTTGETWSIGAGYELTINAIDARKNPRQVWFTLKKDGAIVDEGIGQAPSAADVLSKEKAVYYKTKTIQGESDALLFVIYIDTIFSGATSELVQFKYAWLIDESSAKEIKATDRFGMFEVRTANPNSISLSNENIISLSKNTETTLIGGIKFKVADNDNLRFYPKVDYYIIPDSSRPPYSLSININNGEAYTSSTSVTLAISAANAAQMSFSNDGASWSSWEPFTTTKSWALTPGNGTRTVYFKAKNNNGESSQISDSIILDTVRPAVSNLTSDKSFVNNKWYPGTINPPIKIIANITDNFELQEVTLVFVNNQSGIIPFVWTLTGQGVGTAYNYSWNATQWEISNATKNISSAIVFNIGYPDSNFPALGEQLLVAQGMISIDSSNREQEGFVIFDENYTMHLVGIENTEPYYISQELLNLSCECSADYEDYKSNNMILQPGNSTFTPIAYKVNLNLNGDPQKNSLEKMTFSGRPEDHFNMSLRQIPVAEGEYLIGVHVVDKAGNQNDDEILNVKVDNSSPVVNFTGLVNNTTIRFNENIVKGDVLDTSFESAKLIIKNKTMVIVSQYDLTVSNNKFLERVEFAPDQNNTLELNAKDKAGNTNNTSRQVFVKNNYIQPTLDVNRSVPVKIDAKNETDTEIEFISNINQTNVTFTITAITYETQIEKLNGSAFALSKEMAVGKIVEVNLSGLNATNESEVQSVIIKMHYNIADLDLNGDGIISAGDLDENNMFIYWLNTTGNWTKLLTNNPTWVIDSGRARISGGTPGNVWVKVRHLSTFGIAAGLVPEPTDSGSVYNPGGGSSNGGGGGGGGGASGENYTNIEVIEKYDLQISKDVLTSYRFTHEKNPIMFVNITGNTSIGIITTSAEVLKNTSTLVKLAPEWPVYKNVNIWVGTSGFATPKNIKEALIRFRVESSWISSNNLAGSDIKLLRWDGSQWVTLETSEKDKDSTYTYFEAKTNAFSPFSISGLKEVTSAVAPVVTAATPTPVITARMPVEEKPTTNLALIIGVLLVIGIVVVLYLQRKGKSR